MEACIGLLSLSKPWGLSLSKPRGLSRRRLEEEATETRKAIGFFTFPFSLFT